MSFFKKNFCFFIRLSGRISLFFNLIK
jgi:hypothetical protein